MPLKQAYLVAALAVLSVGAIATPLWLMAREEPLVLNGIEPRCFANNEGVTCTFVNDSSNRRAGCVRGKVTRQDGQGIADAESQSVCSGILEPYSSAEVSVRWQEGKPSEVCPDDELGDRAVKWDDCAFSVDERFVYR